MNCPGRGTFTSGRYDQSLRGVRGLGRGGKGFRKYQLGSVQNWEIATVRIAKIAFPTPATVELASPSSVQPTYAHRLDAHARRPVTHHEKCSKNYAHPKPSLGAHAQLPPNKSRGNILTSSLASPAPALQASSPALSAAPDQPIGPVEPEPPSPATRQPPPPPPDPSSDRVKRLSGFSCCTFRKRSQKDLEKILR